MKVIICMNTLSLCSNHPLRNVIMLHLILAECRWRAQETTSNVMLAWAVKKKSLHYIIQLQQEYFYLTYQSHIFWDIFHLSSWLSSLLHYHLMILWKHIIKFFINTMDLSRVCTSFVHYGIEKCLSTLLSTHFNYMLTTSYGLCFSAMMRSANRIRAGEIHIFQWHLLGFWRGRITGSSIWNRDKGIMWLLSEPLVNSPPHENLIIWL